MRVYNFSPGPSVLPLPVLERAAAEMCDTNGTGQSVMEMSHRSKDFKPIIERTEALLRGLMGIPANYRVLFLQGGASTQFAMVPLNLGAVEPGAKRNRASLVETGIWAKKALDEAAKYVDIEARASSKDAAYRYIPAAPAPQPDDCYYYICLNNTIVGTRWDAVPETGPVPLVADISSCALSEPLDVSKFGLLFAGAQKNLGPAGVTVVIVRDDLIGHAPSWTPVMLRYETHAEEGSLYNTPPCYAIYIMGLVLEWLEGEGGVAAIGRRNREKAALLYDYLDSSALFRPVVQPPHRSIMNVPFITGPGRGNEALDKEFLAAAEKAGLVNLAGHRLVGGLRASMYNAMPIEGAQKLVEVMRDFEARHVSH
ncbi:MAG: 3-phosphoserine/phosphohydroxythreonine transaminase [Spirochaetaceae bacterium]|jgi:phosphoserine aminotransferase|nr:3-phosphoserine/phosphohydroxythreonine transaminase [Spirochaetaceae bacterium]